MDSKLSEAYKTKGPVTQCGFPAKEPGTLDLSDASSGKSVLLSPKLRSL